MYFPFLSLFLSLERYARGPYILPDTPFVQDNRANISSKMGEISQKNQKKSEKILQNYCGPLNILLVRCVNFAYLSMDKWTTARYAPVASHYVPLHSIAS